jgi:hypothetical protein
MLPGRLLNVKRVEVKKQIDQRIRDNRIISNDGTATEMNVTERSVARMVYGPTQNFLF